MDRHNDAELCEAASLKENADNRLLHKLEVMKFVYWVAGIIICGVVAVTLWVANIQHNQSDLRRDIDYNHSAVKDIWKEVFHYPLP